jgi:predicted metal-dependent peptidase
MHGIGLESGAIVDGDPSFFGDQAGTRRVLHGLHATANERRKILADYGRDDGYISTHQNLEYSRVENVRTIEGDFKVYDLVTTGQSFTANGIVTHNCDYAVNLIVIEAGFVLPENKHYNLKYKGWLVDAIYDDLIKETDKLTAMFSMPGKGGQDGSGQTPLWGMTMEPCNDDGSAMSDAQKTELSEDIKIKTLQAATAAKSVGKLPKSLESLIEAIGKPTVNWQDYIQSWVSGKRPDDYTWKRPNRKMLGLYNMFAPSVQLNGAGVGVLSIDTSGSVSDAELVKYVTEVVGLIEICNPSKLYIMQHDTRVNRIDEWEQGEDFSTLKVTHRGGTCITPSFKAAQQLDEEVDWMICFTDCGIVDYPKEAPGFPVLWAATGPNNTPFGTYLPLRDAVSAVS